MLSVFRKIHCCPLIGSSDLLSLFFSKKPTFVPIPPNRMVFSSELKTDWVNVFSEENKRRCIYALDSDQNNNFRTTNSSWVAAVLVPFCYNVRGQPGLLCNLRSANLTSHKGEISFPGGALEKQDKNNPITTALRETEEELGISMDDIEVWTTCRVFPTLSKQKGVVPVVGFINRGLFNPKMLRVNLTEVDHAFVIPLEHLCSVKNWGEILAPPLGPGVTLPTFGNMHKISDKLAGIHLWGLTAFITHLALTALIPMQYKRKIDYNSLMGAMRSRATSWTRPINLGTKTNH